MISFSSSRGVGGKKRLVTLIGWPRGTPVPVEEGGGFLRKERNRFGKGGGRGGEIVSLRVQECPAEDGDA